MADARIAVGIAVHGTQEEHLLRLPLLGYKARVGHVPVEQVGVQHLLVLQLLTELVELDAVVTPGVRGEVQADLCFRDVEHATLLVRLDLPPNWAAWVGVEVCDCGLDFHLCSPTLRLTRYATPVVAYQAYRLPYCRELLPKVAANIDFVNYR